MAVLVLADHDGKSIRKATLNTVAAAQKIFFGSQDFEPLHRTTQGTPFGHVMSPWHCGPGQSIWQV